MAINPVDAYINRLYAESRGQKYFDQRLGGSINSARRNLANIQRQFGQGSTEAQIAYDELSNQLLRDRDRSMEQNRGQFAGQGILRSGIYATEQGRVGEAYQRDLTSAGNTRTQALARLNNARTAGQDEIINMLYNESADAIGRMQQRRAEEEERRLQAQFRAQQLALQQQALAQQRAFSQQQLAIAQQGARGGAGAGGRAYSLEDLFPQARPNVYPPRSIQSIARQQQFVHSIPRRRATSRRGNTGGGSSLKL